MYKLFVLLCSLLHLLAISIYVDVLYILYCVLSIGCLLKCAFMPLSASYARLVCSKAGSRTSHTYIVTSLIYFISIILSLYLCILSTLFVSSIGLMFFLLLCYQYLLLAMLVSTLALLVLPIIHTLLQCAISISVCISFVNKLILSMLYYRIIIKYIISLIVYELMLSIGIAYVCMCMVVCLCCLRGQRLCCVIFLYFCGGQTSECERLEKKISLQSCVHFLVQNKKN